MNVVLFGASGMVGQEALRECLADPDVAQVLSLGRSRAGQQHPKLHEIVHENLFDLSPRQRELTGMTFIYVSGAGSDSSEHGRTMWARIKGKTENALLRLPLQGGVHVSPRCYLKPVLEGKDINGF
jgi:aspartate-semialdehyde dehydrogenase